MYKKLGLILIFVMLSGCATHYSSVNKSGVVGYEIALCSQKEMLDSAYEAIEKLFPDTSITQLAGRKIGYSFYVLFLLDRTNFDFVIQKIQANVNGKVEEGYVYKINTYGTQAFVRLRYVNPLIQEFERVLARKGIMLAKVPAIKYAGSAHADRIR